MKQNQMCLKLCNKTYDESDTESLQKLAIMKTGMSLNYQHHWIVGTFSNRNEILYGVQPGKLIFLG